jgi:hypothetical protein
MEREFSLWRKKEGYREFVGEDFIPYMTISLLLGRG